MLVRVSDKNPWIILIHGFGVTEKVWFAPLEEKTLFISFKTLMKDEKEVIPFAERCNGLSYNIACWSQGVHSSIDEAADQLKDLDGSVRGGDVVFIAHSRGGLVARRAIQKYGLNPKALICLSTPHFGSRFADFVISHRNVIRRCLKSMDDFMAPISELHTSSNIIREINSPHGLELERHVPHFDICGDTTGYFNIAFFNVMKSIEKIFGNRLIPEWRDGYGDGFVSVESAKSLLTLHENYFKMPVNHANILIDSKVWGVVKTILSSCTPAQQFL